MILGERMMMTTLLENMKMNEYHGSDPVCSFGNGPQRTTIKICLIRYCTKLLFIVFLCELQRIGRLARLATLVIQVTILYNIVVTAPIIYYIIRVSQVVKNVYLDKIKLDSLPRFS